MKSARFIIVDDDAINNMLCKLSIARHFGPVQITSYQNPELALAAIASENDNIRPIVLLLDIHMPQMNGWDFLDRLTAFRKALSADILVYIVSATAEQADIERSEKHPLVSGFISKPVTDKKLESMFRKLPDVCGIGCFG